MYYFLRDLTQFIHFYVYLHVLYLIITLCFWKCCLSMVRFHGRAIPLPFRISHVNEGHFNNNFISLSFCVCLRQGCSDTAEVQATSTTSSLSPSTSLTLISLLLIFTFSLPVICCFHDTKAEKHHPDAVVKQGHLQQLPANDCAMHSLLWHACPLFMCGYTLMGSTSLYYVHLLNPKLLDE